MTHDWRKIDAPADPKSCLISRSEKRRPCISLINASRAIPSPPCKRNRHAATYGKHGKTCSACAGTRTRYCRCLPCRLLCQNDQSWVSAAAAVLDAATLATWSIETNDTEAARTCVQTGTRALLATADALGRTRSATEPGGTGPSREKYEVARARLCSSGMRLDSSRPGIPNGTSSSACVSNMRMLCSSWHVELSRRLDDILGDQVES